MMPSELDVNFFDQKDNDIDLRGHKIPPRIGETVMDDKGKFYSVVDVIWFTDIAINGRACPKCSVILKKAKR